MDILSRAHQPVGLKFFEQRNSPLNIAEFELEPPIEEQRYRNIIVRDTTRSDNFYIPDELQWAKLLINTAYQHQTNEVGLDHPYTYLTIRSGPVRTKTDDTWHTDGFSMKVDCLPQLSYFWSDAHPTDITEIELDIPDDFDPMVHNIFTFFEHERAKSDQIEYRLRENNLYLVDPYIFHRRQPGISGLMRTFVRCVFSPIIIPDVNLTPNPALPTPKLTDGVAFRNSLLDYHAEKT